MPVEFNETVGYNTDLGNTSTYPNSFITWNQLYPYLNLNFDIVIGDHPGYQSFTSQDNFITSITYTKIGSNSATYQCFVNRSLILNKMGWLDFSCVCGFRNNVNTSSTTSNDVITPIMNAYDSPNTSANPYFTLYTEDFSTSTQNVSIVG